MAEQSQTHTAVQRGSRGLIILAFIAFISLGMPDGLWGVAAPFVRQTFSVGYNVMWMSMVAGVIGYSTSGFFSGRIMAKLGVGYMLAGSVLLTGLTLLGNTLVPSWYWWVGIAVFGGIGAGAIDSGLNTYMASHYGEHLMQWLHASYGVGVTMGPLIMTAGLNYFNTWRLGYQIVSGGQLLLALTFFLTVKMWTDHAPQAEDGEKKLHEYDTPIRATLANPAAWVSVGLFLLYVGTEIAYGGWTYSILYESRHVDKAVAGLMAASFWGTFTIGRMLSGVISRKVGAKGLITGGMVLGICGAVVLWLIHSPVASLVAVAFIGFAMAPIFPALMSLTASRVGDEHAANTIGMQIAAAGVGGALLPGLAGVLASTYTLEIIPPMLLIQFVALFSLYLISQRRRTS